MTDMHDVARIDDIGFQTDKRRIDSWTVEDKINSNDSLRLESEC